MISQSTPSLALPLAVSINVLLNPAVRFGFFGGLKSPPHSRRVDLAGL